MPEEQKNTDYWLKRRKNNEAARRSREKRKMNDVLLERRVMVLTEENKQLRAQLLAIKMKYGELTDICTPLTSSVDFTRDFYDSSKFDSDSSDGNSDLQSFMGHSKDMVDSSSRLFTSKVFTNASGDTSATVHVNKLPGNPQTQNNKFMFPDFSVMNENSMSRQRIDQTHDLNKSRRGLPNFDFAREHHSEAAPERHLVCRANERRASSMTDSDRVTDNYEIGTVLSQYTNKNEEEAALLLAGKFNSDILRTLNMNQQVPFSNFTHLAKEAMEKLGYSYAQSLRTNGPMTPAFSLPADAFFRSLRDKAINDAPSSSKNQISPPMDKYSNKPANGVGEFSASPPCTTKRDAQSPQYVAENQASGAKHKAPDDIVTCRSPKLSRGTESPEDTTPPSSHQLLNEVQKRSPVQLPHKLRLKKAANYEIT